MPHAIDNSFPSDHTALASVFATVAYLRHRYVGLSLWVFTGAIALARVAAGLHWPLDIMVALVLGVAALYIARFACSAISTSRV